MQQQDGSEEGSDGLEGGLVQNHLSDEALNNEVVQRLEGGESLKMIKLVNGLLRELASTPVLPDEESELILTRAAVHVKSDHIQYLLYQLKEQVQLLVQKHGIHILTEFIVGVEYGQSMELRQYAKEQPGCTYYYVPLGKYNLGIVDHDHDHDCDDGYFNVHLHSHV
jgi:hypothetical protein